MKMKLATTVLTAVLLCGCSPGNLDYVKEESKEIWNSVGYEIVGYEGYQWGFWGFNTYGGARVWYRVDQIEDNGITYTGYLQRWGDEIHVYGPKAIDAIRP
jgi:hypothetical protein